MDHLSTALDHLLNILPAALVFVIGFVWHTRSLLASLQEEIKEARREAAEATRKAKEFNDLFAKEVETRTEMGRQLWERVNSNKHELGRIEVMLDHSSPSRRR